MQVTVSIICPRCKAPFLPPEYSGGDGYRICYCPECVAPFLWNANAMMGKVMTRELASAPECVDVMRKAREAQEELYCEKGWWG